MQVRVRPKPCIRIRAIPELGWVERSVLTNGYGGVNNVHTVAKTIATLCYSPPVAEISAENINHSILCACLPSAVIKPGPGPKILIPDKVVIHRRPKDESAGLCVN